MPVGVESGVAMLRGIEKVADCSIGILNCLKACAIAFPVANFLIPFTALLPSTETRVIGVFVVLFIKCWASIFAFPCSTILLTNSATSLRVLGTLNGFATSTSALGRAAGPFMGGESVDSYEDISEYIAIRVSHEVRRARCL